MHSKTRSAYFLLFILTIFLFGETSFIFAGQIYKCRNSAGQLSFQEVPCSQDQITDKVMKFKDNKNLSPAKTFKSNKPSQNKFQYPSKNPNVPAPAPIIPKVDFSDLNLTKDAAGNGVVSGKITNSWNVDVRVNLDLQLVLNNGQVKRINNSFGSLPKDKTKKFKINTHMPFSSIQGYHMGGKAYILMKY